MSRHQTTRRPRLRALKPALRGTHERHGSGRHGSGGHGSGGGSSRHGSGSGG
jgi:hypothetical protein